MTMRHARPADRRRGRAAQRLRRLGAALLRAAGADRARPARRAASAATSAACCAGWRSSAPPATSGCRWTRSLPRSPTLPDGRAPTRADWTRLSRSWRGRLDEQIAALQRLRDGLDSCIGCGCLSLRTCAISNPGDVAGALGSGARYLPRPLRVS